MSGTVLGTYLYKISFEKKEDPVSLLERNEKCKISSLNYHLGGAFFSFVRIPPALISLFFFPLFGPQKF